MPAAYELHLRKPCHNSTRDPHVIMVELHIIPLEVKALTEGIQSTLASPVLPGNLVPPFQEQDLSPP